MYEKIATKNQFCHTNNKNGKNRLSAEETTVENRFMNSIPGDSHSRHAATVQINVISLRLQLPTNVHITINNRHYSSSLSLSLTLFSCFHFFSLCSRHSDVKRGYFTKWFEFLHRKFFLYLFLLLLKIFCSAVMHCHSMQPFKRGRTNLTKHRICKTTSHLQ